MLCVMTSLEVCNKHSYGDSERTPDRKTVFPHVKRN